MTIRNHHIILCCLILTLAACGNDQNNPIPSFPVYFDMDIEGQYPHFIPSNGFNTMTFTQKKMERDAIGYAGLLIEVDMAGRYQAFDLACPNCVDQSCPLEVDGIFAGCPKCGERYDISYGLGFPQNGISRYALRRYATYYNGIHLIIRN